MVDCVPELLAAALQATAFAGAASSERWQQTGSGVVQSAASNCQVGSQWLIGLKMRKLLLTYMLHDARVRAHETDQPLAVHSVLWNIIQMLFPGHAKEAANIQSPATPLPSNPFVRQRSRSYLRPTRAERLPR